MASEKKDSLRVLVDNVTKTFSSRNGRVCALQGVSLAVREGEFVCLLGPSGCGKSTLLNLVASLELPDHGAVFINGKTSNGPGPDRVVIFQEPALFPWLTVIKNVEFGLKMRGLGRTQRRDISRRYLQMVHLSRFEKAYVHELSGGMKQRVALARALAMETEILLMDEPFGALDAQTRDILLDDLQTIWGETRKTILYVTHNVQEALYLGDRVVLFSARPGQVKREYHIALPRPRSLGDPRLNAMAGSIMKELREEIDKVVKEELDHGWTPPQDNLFRPAPADLGSGI